MVRRPLGNPYLANWASRQRTMVLPEVVWMTSTSIQRLCQRALTSVLLTVMHPSDPQLILPMVVWVASLASLAEVELPL